MNLLNEVEVLTAPRLSEDIFRPTHYETNLKQGAHTAWPVPVIGSCQYLTHAHSHITRAVAVMDSCFALIGAHQHGIAVIVLSLSRIKMSKIQVNQQWRQSACSLRGRRLKGNGKEIPGAREARKACKGKEKESSPLPYPSRAVSQPNSPHEIYRNLEGTATRLSETLKQPLKKLKEDVTNTANTNGSKDGRTWRKIETDCSFENLLV